MPETWDSWILAPQDGLFLKDGRGWFTSSSGRAEVLDWPAATTVRGALRSAFARRVEAVRIANDGPALRVDSQHGNEWRDLSEVLVCGPVLPIRRSLTGADQDWSTAERMWPVPEDMSFPARRGTTPAATRLEPAPRSPNLTLVGTALDDDDPTAQARHTLWSPTGGTKQAPRPRWLPEDCFVRFLSEAACSGQHLSEFAADDARAAVRPEQRTQVHVSIDADRRAAIDSALFASRILEPVLARRRRAGRQTSFDEWAVHVAVRGHDASCGEHGLDTREIHTLNLGGDRRPSRAMPGAGSWEMPDALAQSFEELKPRGLRLVVADPCYSISGWRPSWLKLDRDSPRFLGQIPGLSDQVVLRAALVDRPMSISGWDLDLGQPKDTLRLIPAGSVFYFQKTSMEAFDAEDARALWLTSIGDPVDGMPLGHAVPGVWMAPDGA